MNDICNRFSWLAVGTLSLSLASCGGGGHGSHAKVAAVDSSHSSAHGEESHSPDSAEMVEVDLGEFTITQRQPGANSILLIRFKIFGVVEHDKKEAFAKLLEERRQRMRDSVITIVQRAGVEQLSDPSLGWLKSELIPAVNKLLRTRMLKDVVFSDFAMLQS